MKPIHAKMHRALSALMLALAMVYLVHAAKHAALGEAGPPPPGAALALAVDPFVLAESQNGDGLVGCHFFCNHGCPVPPLPVEPALPTPPHRAPFLAAGPAKACRVARVPETSPPRFPA